jgi:secretory carrier-associated membrane protein
MEFSGDPDELQGKMSNIDDVARRKAAEYGGEWAVSLLSSFLPFSLFIPAAEAYAHNPFASTHSLDTNPFDDPTTPTTHSATSPSHAAEAARLEQLRQRELDLERREQELAAKANNLRHHGKNNWPPFFPLIFHSIADEIPEASRPLITRLYQLWLVLLLTLIVNMVACIFILLAGADDGARDLGASIGYLFIISVTSFLLWYRPIYNGYMKEQSLYFYFYFFFGGFHLLFSVYMIIGVPRCVSPPIIYHDLRGPSLYSLSFTVAPAQQASFGWSKCSSSIIGLLPSSAWWRQSDGSSKASGMRSITAKYTLITPPRVIL